MSAKSPEETEALLMVEAQDNSTLEEVDFNVKKAIKISLGIMLVLLGTFGVQAYLIFKQRQISQQHEAAEAYAGSKSLDINQMSIVSSRSVEDEIRMKAARLTHLIIPYHEKQMWIFHQTLQYWTKYLPCQPLPEQRNGTAYQDGMSYFQQRLKFPLGHNISLVFFGNGIPRSGNEAKIMEFYNSLPTAARACFSNVTFAYAKLSGEEDEYLVGSKNMFEKMMRNKLDLPGVEYVYYMELDCRPVRPYWLSIVDSLTRFPNPKFWIKGSIFRGNFSAITYPEPHNLFHINGNALYNLGEREFREFYFKQVKPYVNGAEGGYDGDFFKLLMERERYDINRHYGHLFQFSDFVQNRWRALYNPEEVKNLSDITVLVHGGYPFPKPVNMSYDHDRHSMMVTHITIDIVATKSSSFI